MVRILIFAFAVLAFAAPARAAPAWRLAACGAVALAGSSEHESAQAPSSVHDEVADAAVQQAVAFVAADEARPSNPTAASAEEKPPVQPQAPAAQPSAAERIARLQRAIDSDERRLAELLAQRNDPLSDYHRAEAEFKNLDNLLAATRKRLEELENPGDDGAAELEAEVAEIEQQRNAAKARFDLEIDDRKVLVEQIGVLEEKLRQDREVLAKLTGTDVPASEPIAPRVAPPESSPPVDPAVPEGKADRTTGDSPLPGILPADLFDSSASTPSAQPSGENQSARPPKKEVVDATEEVERSEALAREAEEDARSITARKETLLRNIELERALRESTRRRIDHADEVLKSGEREFVEKLMSGASADELMAIRRRIHEAEDRIRESREEGRRRSSRIDELQGELTELQAEQIAALERAQQRRSMAEAARQRLAQLQNPFAPRNIAAWLLDHGPRIAAILLFVMGFLWVSKRIETRLVTFMSHRGGRGSPEEQENRARTLVGVFHNATSVIIIVGAVLMVLDEIGIPIGPLMGGAAVFGLAVAFGAQTLIKDFFTGFMILLEQQYMVNDVVRIGDIAGQVERISLRTTVLRDLEGCVHFIPHGQITTATNMTHGWSRALFNIGVAYKENVDRVIAVLTELARQMRTDREFGPLILEDPTMLGVDSFGDSSVVIRFHIKTKPLKQWLVRRELLRRIKNKFDELGIEIPFPHRTVYHHYENEAARDADEVRSHWSGEEAA